MTKYFYGFLFLFPFLMRAQTPTWASDIAPILFTKCTSCHHQGGMAPNSLMTYSQAANYSFLIKNYVQQKKMPPWPPDPNYKHLAFERTLTQTEITKIVNWANGGAPQGNPNLAPAPPVYGNPSTQLSQVDFTAKMPDYTVNTAQDLYRCFVIPTNFNVDRFAQEIEVIPGNSSIVHHVIVFEDTAQQILNMDNNDPGPGYTSFFGTGSNSSRMVGEWVPGTAPIKFPAGMGVRLKANTRLILQIHYPAGTYQKLDSTRVNIKYVNSPTPREVFIFPVLQESNIQNGPFVIPANTIKTFKQRYTPQYPLPFTVLSVAPHMHLIGTKYKVYAVKNDNSDTIPYIYIPKWDFKWQGVYNFIRPMKLDGANYKIWGETEYDNTANNPNNPSSPPVQVTQGESTTDEMMQCYAALLLYQAGDENIIVHDTTQHNINNDTTNFDVGLQELMAKQIVKTLQLHYVYPNPARGSAKLSYFSPENLSAKARIFSEDGKLVREWPANFAVGAGDMNLSLEGLSRGQYFLRVEAKSYTKSLAFVVYE